MIKGRTPPTIPAKETVYNSYHFRSRLEARWAVFFDTLGIKYEYEKERIDLTSLLNPELGRTDGGASPNTEETAQEWCQLFGIRPLSYLPDFWIPHLQCWIEIKGQEPTREEEALASMLAYVSDRDVFVFYGDIQIPGQHDIGGTPSYKHFADLGWDADYFWCECPDCGNLGIEFDARADRLDCKESHDSTKPGCPRHSGNRDKGYNGNSPRLVQAYTAARSARFEWGEHGR